MRHLFLPFFIIFIAAVLIPNTFAQEAVVPSWIKNNAGWWASDQIPDSAFLLGIQHLIKEGIMVIPTPETPKSSGSQEVPTWIKNTAGWWAEDKISEVEFVNAIQYLIKNGIVIINENSSCINDLSEMFGDSIAVVQNTCDLHESSEYSELVPFVGKSNLNDLGFRGPEFSEIKPSNTYRIFMVGGSTMFGSGATSDETTIPGILQKIFDSDNSNLKKIEVINVGFSGATSITEFDLFKQKLVSFSPDLIIFYDGWNDLRVDSTVYEIKSNWKRICEIGKKNDFDIIITLQPIAGFGNKKLTQQEIVNSLTGEDHQGFQLIAAKSTYDYMNRELLSLRDDCNVIDLRGIFDDVSGPIYWDQGHASDTGNLIVAEKFHWIVNEMMFNKKSNENKFHSVISKYNSPVITSYLLSKIGIDVDYNQIKEMYYDTEKRDGDFFWLKNQLGGSEKILVGKDLSKADLSKINLTGQNLSGANLSGQDLRKIDFTGTILRGANLSFANLSGMDLSGMDLRGINFRNANLENADLTNITISKYLQFFSQPECSHPDDALVNNKISDNDLQKFMERRCAIDVAKNELTRTDFSNANMKGVTISESKNAYEHHHFMHFVDFSGADLTGIEFSNLEFTGCKFNGTNFNNSDMRNVKFFSCDFTDAKFINSKFDSVFFQDVSFRDAKIIDASFKNLFFIDFVDLYDADLSGTSLYEVYTIGNIVFSCKNHPICD